MDPNDYPELLNDLPGYEVIEITKDSGEFISIFDDPRVANAMYGDPDVDPYSTPYSTLRDISDAFDFSIDFLGDFVVQLGAYPPIDVDTPINTYLTGDQIFSLLQSLNSLDPSDASLDYDSMSADEVCEEFGLDAKTFLRICEVEDLNLPFGMTTVLHCSAVERVRAVMGDDVYANRSKQNRADEEEGEEGEERYGVTNEDKNVW